MAKSLLYVGNIVSVSELHDAYLNILSANTVQNFVCSRKYVKDLLAKRVPGIEFCKSTKKNVAEKVLVNTTTVELVSKAYSARSIDDDMTTSFESAKILRGMISECEPWKFTGTLSNSADDASSPTLL